MRTLNKDYTRAVNTLANLQRKDAGFIEAISENIVSDVKAKRIKMEILDSIQVDGINIEEYITEPGGEAYITFDASLNGVTWDGEAFFTLDEPGGPVYFTWGTLIPSDTRDNYSDYHDNPNYLEFGYSDGHCVVDQFENWSSFDEFFEGDTPDYTYFETNEVGGVFFKGMDSDILSDIWISGRHDEVLESDEFTKQTKDTYRNALRSIGSTFAS